jgi:hypothetical protein
MYRLPSNSIAEVHALDSEHIDNARLRMVVAEETTMSPAEIEHLRSCEECLELIRILVRHRIAKATES